MPLDSHLVFEAQIATKKETASATPLQPTGARCSLEQSPPPWEKKDRTHQPKLAGNNRFTQCFRIFRNFQTSQVMASNKLIQIGNYIVS